MDGVLNILSPRKAQSRRFVMDKSPKLQTGNNHLELQIPSQGDIAIKNFLSLDLQEQQTVLAQNSSIISQIQSQSQNTLLFLSVQADNYQLSKLLLDNYANANHQNKFKETPLHKAIEIGNHKMINLLLENGANPNIQQVVVHNRATGQSYFEIMDMSTMTPVPNTDKYDNSFLEDTHMDFTNNIATNVNLGESYPIVQIGGDPILKEY